MDMQTKRKALPRTKLNSPRKEKCTVFPLVRYNEFRQPVCQVCNVVMMESISAHLGSPQHREVMSNLQANATGSTQHNNAKPVTDTNPPKANNPEQRSDSRYKLPECSPEVPKRQSPLVRSPDFLDDRDTVRTRSVSKGTKVMDPPKEQHGWVSNNETAEKSKVLTSKGESSRPLKSSRRKQAKPTAFRMKKISDPPTIPRRSKRIKHVADKTIKNTPEESVSIGELMKGPAAENSEVDVKEVFFDVDGLVIYKRKRLTHRRASGQTSNSPSLSKQTVPTEPSTAAISSSAAASPPHEDPPATALVNIDTPHIENNTTAERMLSEGLVEEAKKVGHTEANTQEQVGSNKSQESPDQPDPKTDEVSTVNTPLNLEAINKMIEDDPLSALDYILAGKLSFSSKTQQSTAPSGPPKVQSSPADALSKELKDLMQASSLGDLVTDYKQMSKVLFILDELQKNEEFFSLAQQTFIKNLRLFFDNAVTHHKECDTAGAKKVELNQAKEEILLKLREAKLTQEQITASISNANNKVNEISSHIEQLEEQILKLKEEKETFQLAVNECGKQREKLKSDSILWAHQGKDLVFDLADTEAQLKTLGEQLEADKASYVQFKACFPF